MIRRLPHGGVRAAGLLAPLLGLAAAPSLPAQMLEVPVAQNAFVSPGITVAFNFGSGERGRTYGVAAAYGSGGARWQLSAGLGSFERDTAGNALTLGARGALSVYRFLDGQAGVAVFGGVGGANYEAGRELAVPLGGSVGWVRAWGEERAISLYAAPYYSWTRIALDPVADDEEGITRSEWLFRSSVGADLLLRPNIGLTVAVDFGQTGEGGPPVGPPGPAGTLFGVAVSYAWR